jgi:hypothetical protein
MPGKAFVIRFPSGDFEYDLTVTGRALPAVGDTMRRRGVLWLVTRITQELVDVVHVERVDTRKAEEHVT